MLGTAAAAWENLQGKSCTGTMNIHNFIQFADICKKQLITIDCLIINDCEKV
jgi:hypothetical protein